MRSVVLLALLVIIPATVSAQTATLRIQVRTEDGPVPDVEVVVNGTTHKTDAQGMLVVTLPSGHAEIVVVKEGFAPTSASVELQSSQQQPVVVDLNRGPSQLRSTSRYPPRVQTNGLRTCPCVSKS